MNESRKKEFALLKKMWNKGYPACTIELAKKFLKKYPKTSPVWMMLGNELTSIARYDEARQALQKAIRYCPKERLDYAFVNMGHLYNEKGQFKIAERWYRRALEENPRDTSNLHFFGCVLANQGKFAIAKKFHRLAAKVATDPPDEAYCNLGLVLRAEGRYKEALKYFEKAIAVDPKYKVAKNARNDILELFKIRKRS
jgi:tetratricopeptide (TPR) repeat protein